MALSTSRTVVTNTGLSTHHHFRVRDLLSVGVATFSNFKTGSTNIHSVGVEAAGINVLGADTPIGTGSTIYNDGGARFSGIVTATSFVGSGANLTGIDATAIQTGTTKIQTSATLISNQISGSGIATVQAGGLDVTGVVTATTFSGSGANLTSLPAANITGTLPAISGANLTNLDASDLASGTVPTARLGSGTASSSTFLAGDSTFKTVSGTTINNNADNRLITGSGTANTLNGESTLTYDGTTLALGGGKNMTLAGPSGTSYSLSIEPIVSTPYGFRVKEPSSVSNGYPLIAATQNGGGTLFRVLSGTGVAETRTMQPVTDNTYDLGTSSKRYANLYTTDLQLSNEGKTNDVDGTWGNYTIQEGESDLFLINNRNGKKYKFNLTEVS